MKRKKNGDTLKMNKLSPILRENREKVEKGFSNPTGGSRETMKIKKMVLRSYGRIERRGEIKMWTRLKNKRTFSDPTGESRESGKKGSPILREVREKKMKSKNGHN